MRALLLVLLVACTAAERVPTTRPAGVTPAKPHSLALGEHHGCFVLSDHTVRCWGSNAQGAVGDGTLIDRPRPVAVESLRDVRAIAVSAGTSCALHTDGTVSCWGILTTALQPKQIVGLAHVEELS